MKIFQEGSMNNKGFFNYYNLYLAGMSLQTNLILQRYIKLIIKEDTVFHNLKLGLKINNLILYDKSGKFHLENIHNFHGQTKISIDNLFIIYRYFEVLYLNKIKYPFSIDLKIFLKILDDSKKKNSNKEEEICANILKNTTATIEKNFENFKNVAQSAGKNTLNKKDFLENIFNLIDLNNNSFIEVYEIMYLDKIRSIFEKISENGFIKKNKKTENLKDNVLRNKLRDYNMENVYEISDEEIENIFIVSD